MLGGRKVRSNKGKKRGSRKNVTQNLVNRHPNGRKVRSNKGKKRGPYGPRTGRTRSGRRFRQSGGDCSSITDVDNTYNLLTFAKKAFGKGYSRQDQLDNDPELPKIKEAREAWLNAQCPLEGGVAYNHEQAQVDGVPKPDISALGANSPAGNNASSTLPPTTCELYGEPVGYLEAQNQPFTGCNKDCGGRFMGEPADLVLTPQQKERIIAGALKKNPKASEKQQLELIGICKEDSKHSAPPGKANVFPEYQSYEEEAERNFCAQKDANDCKNSQQCAYSGVTGSCLPCKPKSIQSEFGCGLGGIGAKSHADYPGALVLDVPEGTPMARPGDQVEKIAIIEGGKRRSKRRIPKKRRLSRRR